MTRADIYNWMENQIVAAELQKLVPDKGRPFYINNASNNGREIHVYGIKNLCKELDLTPIVEKHYTRESDKYYIIYKGYKFFGLVEVDE